MIQNISLPHAVKSLLRICRRWHHDFLPIAKTIFHIIYFWKHSPGTINTKTICLSNWDAWLVVISVETNFSPSGRDRNQWRKTKVNGLFYYSKSVWVGGAGKGRFLQHIPLTHQKKKQRFVSKRRQKPEQKDKKTQSAAEMRCQRKMDHSGFALCFVFHLSIT